MQASRHLFVCVLSSVLILFPTLGGAQPAPSDRRSIFAMRISPEQASAIIVGAGVRLSDTVSSKAAIDPKGNELAWKPIREDTASNGWRHILYRQYYHSRDGNEAAIRFADLRVHFDAEGRFSGLNGHQYTEIDVRNTPRLARAAVPEVALQALARDHRINARPLTALGPKELVTRQQNTDLEIIRDSRGEHRFVYSTFVNDVLDEQYVVLLDAESAVVIDVLSTRTSLNCYPSPYSSANASGYPANVDLARMNVRRPLLANDTSDRPAPFTYEGFMVTTPHKSVLQETANTDFMCSPSSPFSYTLLPVRIENGAPVYKDVGDEWKGNIAGDALYHTDRTMVALASLGWNSFDNRGGDANIEVEVGGADNASYFENLDGNPRFAPGSSVLVARRGTVTRSLAASLDIIAHEWGHGVTSKAWGLRYNQGLLTYEAFSDAIAHAVEKRTHTSPKWARDVNGYYYLVENGSDWSIGEDSELPTSRYVRSGTLDDIDGHYFGTTLVNDAFHRYDGESQDFHDRANMMNVVAFLMSDGGTNPICTRLTSLSGCGWNMSGIGATAATQILFDTAVYYATSATQFGELPDLAAQAAFDRYSTCGIDDNAATQQNAVINAFFKVGYPVTYAPYSCQ